MGFLQEKKIFLDTRNANRIDNTYSDIHWKLRTTLHNPNHLYKTKIQLSNAVLPNTFPRLGEERGNNLMIILFDSYTAIQSLSPFNTLAALQSGNFVVVRLQRSISVQEPVVALTEINLSIVEQMITHPLLSTVPVKPYLTYDEISQQIMLTLVNYTVGNKWANPRIYTTDDLDKVDAVQLQQIPTPSSDQFRFKFMTEADIISETMGLERRDVELAHVIGLLRAVPGPVLTPDSVDRYNRIDEFFYQSDTEPTTWAEGILRTNHGMDLSGTRYIKIECDLPIDNIDPVTKTDKHILACIPLTSTQTESKAVYFIGSVQAPQFFTLGQQSLSNINLKLLDDEDRLLQPNMESYYELTIRYEEEEQMDIYRSFDALLNLSRTRGMSYLESIREMETEKRREDAMQNKKTRY